MNIKHNYHYGKCESCKNCKEGNMKYIFTCSKDKKLKKWDNKCYLYKIKRSLV